MSEYERVIDEIVKHGVAIKVNKIVDDNYIPYERKYVGCVVELDFSEHDKVFKDKIAELQIKNDHLLDEKNKLREIINKKLGGWDDYGVSFEEIFGMRDENKELKQRIAELESKETSDLPFDPLECANYLINATYERETNGIELSFAKLPDKVNDDRYTIDDLEQIAEHLLVYCKHNKESE